MVDDFCHLNMTKNKSHLDWTLKKVHTEGLDSLLSHEESVMQVVRSQTFNIYIQMAKVFCGQFI